MLTEREDIIFHMILDPTFETEQIFLESLIKTFKIEPASSSPTVLDYKEAIKNYLFKKGAEENKTVVLLIDEAQKLNPLSLEILRCLLNYETNEYKLLQVVLLAQLELLPKLHSMKNLWDRINLKYVLNPLDEQETKEMIEFRLRTAGYINTSAPFFTEEAVAHIYQYTQGYPRRISMLCHNALKTLVMESKPVVDAEIVQKLISQEVSISA
jgi:general secretion pathway protein A